MLYLLSYIWNKLSVQGEQFFLDGCWPLSLLGVKNSSGLLFTLSLLSEQQYILNIHGVDTQDEQDSITFSTNSAQTTSKRDESETPLCLLICNFKVSPEVVFGARVADALQTSVMSEFWVCFLCVLWFMSTQQTDDWLHFVYSFYELNLCSLLLSLIVVTIQRHLTNLTYMLMWCWSCLCFGLKLVTGRLCSESIIHSLLKLAVPRSDNVVPSNFTPIGTWLCSARHRLLNQKGQTT